MGNNSCCVTVFFDFNFEKFEKLYRICWYEPCSRDSLRKYLYEEQHGINILTLRSSLFGCLNQIQHISEKS